MTWYICPDCGAMVEETLEEKPIMCSDCGIEMILDEEDPDDDEEE